MKSTFVASTSTSPSTGRGSVPAVRMTALPEHEVVRAALPEHAAKRASLGRMDEHTTCDRVAAAEEPLEHQEP